MNSAERLRWQRTSPLAAIFYLGKVYEAVAKNFVQSVAPLAALVFASEGNLAGRIALGVAAFVAVTIGAAFLRYWFFRFRVAGNSVLIREGVFRKIQLDIKFDRIQAINTEQNFIFRFFGLVTIKLDTAGSSKQEGHLPAIPRDFADALKERIRGERAQSGADRKDEDEPGNEAPPPAPTRPILKLGPADMLRIGLSSNRALVLLVLLGPVIERVTEDVESRIDESAIAAAVESAQIDWRSGAGLVVLIVLGFVLLMVLASVAGAFLRYHGYTLVAEQDVLRSTGGLLTRHEHTVNFAKVQSVAASQNPIHRLFGRLRIGASQASSARQRAGKQFVIPLCTPEKLPPICREIFRGEFPEAALDPSGVGFERISPRYIRSRMAMFGALPALLLCGLLLPAAGAYALVFLAWIPLSGLLVWPMYRKYGYRVAADGMLLRRGFLGYRVVAFTHRKVQRVSVTQTIVQRRKGLATLRIFLASGTLKLPYVDVAQARRLRDYMLYRIESSQRAWH